MHVCIGLFCFILVVMKKALPRDIKKFQKKIWNYYRAHGRHDMAWRKTTNSYRIAVSEIMLQQTQVARVKEKYDLFIKKFPSFAALARTPLAEVLHAWHGLGYNRRALFLKKLAEVVVEKYKGKLPRDPETLHALPGIGKATAGSIAAFAFNHPSVFIETNIRRVFIYFFFPRRKSVHDEEILQLVKAALPHKNSRACPPKCSCRREWYFALMDYGTMLAAREKENPNRKSAHYKKQSKFIGSDRQMRGKIVALLVKKKSLTARTVARHLNEPIKKIKKIFEQLRKEGFVQSKGKLFHLVS